MKRFEFRLQKLLNIRKTEEKGVQAELAKLVSIQNAERLRKEEYQNRMIKEQESIRKKLITSECSYNEASNYARFVDFVERIKLHSDKEITNMEPEINEVRERLIEASRNVKIVERLKAKKWKEHLEEYNREIAKENDETNQKIFMRSKIDLSVLE